MPSNYLVNNTPGDGPTDLDDIFITDEWVIEKHTGGSLWGAGYAGTAFVNPVLGLGADRVAKSVLTQEIRRDADWKLVETDNVFGGVSVGVKTNGTLWVVGHSHFNLGELGLGVANASVSTWVQIGSDANWKYATYNRTQGAAIKYDGSLWMWGENQFGELGLGNTVHRSSPTQVGSTGEWKTV
jgi:hypothetical protein